MNVLSKSKNSKAIKTVTIVETKEVRAKQLSLLTKLNITLAGELAMSNRVFGCKNLKVTVFVLPGAGG